MDWIYVGSESDNTIDFAATGVALANGGVLDIGNQRQQQLHCAVLWCFAANRPRNQWEQPPIKPLSLLRFSFVDQTDGSNVANGANPTDNVCADRTS